ncbi:DUF7373 family lipoprotein [Nocardia mangyaensis]|uniref:DUF7373 family lipoprotein n=1 Tax=Nocardia mangyaensis TaxID=2213200 RepID=UPI000A9DE711|nr:hypothetical protein [Nocardia mangyaensis]
MPSPSTRILACAATIIATALTVAGCGSAVPGSSAPAELDVRKLDVGSYATEPLEMRYTYQNDLGGGLKLAVTRLANSVVTGLDIDPRFKYSTGSIPILDAEKATTVLANATKPALERNKMMFGYAVGSADKKPENPGEEVDDQSFTAVTVLQFPDETSAKQAAFEIEEADFAVAADMNEKVSLAKYPEAHSHWRPGVASIGSVMAKGHYVVSMYLGTTSPDRAALEELAEKTYAAQLPLLDALEPLTAEQALFLDNDPDGMLRRTFNPSGIGLPDPSDQASYTLQGFLHQVADIYYWKPILSDAGVDRFSLSDAGSFAVSMLFRTRDAEAALSLSPKVLERSHPSPADAPAEIPEAKCGEGPGDDIKKKRFRCAVTYRHYVATVEGDQLRDVHQRAAAQYALLANSQ